ncbi:probable ubiquitin-conjugating enzyme E2 33 isoform X2 [Vigna radiata var. radiata]|uniref:E2 ubiquitin-conjugating enzyme n=1 Tax=Vigna radiata var. radiata TaxID=3916 RepID=A0A3Q0EJE6_VIGRR|nr:probable ubiquitin-conjugating enzyme E2 33 isoform X2 [Vigna radiata var. radiata]
MAEKSCIKRLQKEYRALCKEPVSHVVARPSPSDILEWHYVLEGSEGTPFAGGYYYGKIKFPPEYPYKPPGISMTTPNGRFMTQKKICLSMSDFHPESWNPMWSVSSILTGLLSFMMDNSPTTGSVNTTTAEKQRLAKSSLSFNCKNVFIIFHAAQHSGRCSLSTWRSTTSNNFLNRLLKSGSHQRRLLTRVPSQYWRTN